MKKIQTKFTKINKNNVNRKGNNKMRKHKQKIENKAKNETKKLKNK